MAYRTATGPNGEKLYFRSASNEAGEQQWFQVEAPTTMQKAKEVVSDTASDIGAVVKKGVDAITPDQATIDELKAKVRPMLDTKKSYPMMSPSQVRNYNKGVELSNAQINRLLTDPDALLKYKQAKDASSGEAILQSAKGEATAMGQGISELIDKYLPASVSNVLNYRIGGENYDTPEQRQSARADFMLGENTAKAARDIARPFSTTVGSTIPYIASDVMLSPVTGSILNAASKTASLGGKAALRGLEKAENSALRASSSLANEVGNRVVSPLVTTAKNIESRPILSPTTRAATKEIARAPITGAIEGAAHYNMNAQEGALNSFVGQATASGPIKSVLGRTDVKLSKNESDILKQMMRDGYRATPGMKTGSQVLQAKEQGFRSEPRFRDYMAEYDAANHKVLSNYAAEAMGLIDKVDKKTDVSRDLTPETLGNHMANLSSQYKQLEADTTGKFSQSSFKRINDVLKSLQPLKNRNQSQDARRRYAIVQDAVAEMRTVLQPFTNPNGKFAKQEFDGSRYQAASQYLDDQINKAFNESDKILGRNLKAIKKELDHSIENGMSKADSAKWRDLNERYAMTRLVMESGMDALGGIDTKKLTGKLMSGDEAIRTLTSKGNRIKKLQDIAKIDTMQGRQAGAVGWSGSGVEGGDNSRRGLLRSTFATPLITRIPASTRAGMNMYMSGYPAVTGLTGLPKPAIGKIMRAQEQGSQNVSSAVNTGMEQFNDFMKMIQEWDNE